MDVWVHACWIHIFSNQQIAIKPTNQIMDVCLFQTSRPPFMHMFIFGWEARFPKPWNGKNKVFGVPYSVPVIHWLETNYHPLVIKHGNEKSPMKKNVLFVQLKLLERWGNFQPGTCWITSKLNPSRPDQRSDVPTRCCRSWHIPMWCFSYRFLHIDPLQRTSYMAFKGNIPEPKMSDGKRLWKSWGNHTNDSAVPQHMVWLSWNAIL